MNKSVKLKINEQYLEKLRLIYPEQTDDEIIESCIKYTIQDIEKDINGPIEPFSVDVNSV